MAEQAELKPYQAILEVEMTTALHELRRPARGLLWSGLSAGLDIGFSALAVGVVATLAAGTLPPVVTDLLRANAYAIGFIAVVFGRSELFTEHTTLAALPVLSRQASIAQLGRLWAIIFASNVVGTAIFAGFLAIVGPSLGTVSAPALQEIAARLVDHPWWVMFLSAVLAGWMMGLVTWLVSAGRDEISRFLFVWVITGLIGFAGLHHSIVGSVEVLAGWMAGLAIGPADYARFLALSTVGNAVGGIVFVAIIKYAHARIVSAG